MPQTFPRWTNALPAIVGVGGSVLVAASALAFWYYGSPRYTDVGYRPKQPVPYSHKLHAGDLGIDCRYCHTTVEVSPSASVPPTQTCMNCHKLILPESERLLPVRESWASGRPIQWTRVHKLPDYVYFDHSAHVTRGIGCVSCHGNIAEMEVVAQQQPLNMGWCLDCHRNPDPHLRPLQEITNMKWVPPQDQAQFAALSKKDWRLSPPVDCSGCHR
ncbi:MAG TPA: cytochrome c3 family protein [Candidatus Deferrimicrobium sp.]|nr:cytochrome c3 family protein [Candidatus Deferrimicrobium sp.]